MTPTSAIAQPTTDRPVIIGFDPGRDKCGIAVLDMTGQVLDHQVILAELAIAHLAMLQQKFQVQRIVVGDRTTSQAWQAKICQTLLPLPPISPVDEHKTTLEARDRYWKMFPAQGLSRLLPQGLRQPPRPIDDIVAILLVERYLAHPSPQE
jgi:RNase H-fold protein (predicted Holliday junction resolvase)